MNKEGKMNKQTMNKNKVSDVLTDVLAPSVSFFISVPLGSVSPSFSVSPTSSLFHTLSPFCSSSVCALAVFSFFHSHSISSFSYSPIPPISLCQFLKQIYIMSNLTRCPETVH